MTYNTDQEYLNSPEAIKSAKKAVELCLSDPTAVSAVAVDRKGFRVRATKRLYDKCVFYGDMWISIARVTKREQCRIDFIKKRNHTGQIAFTIKRNKMKKLFKKKVSRKKIIRGIRKIKKKCSPESEGWKKHREAIEEYKEY